MGQGEQACFSASAHGELCRPAGEDDLIPEFCPDFCCGSCSSQYCCSDELKKVQWSEDMCTESEARWVQGGEAEGEKLQSVSWRVPCPFGLSRQRALH